MKLTESVTIIKALADQSRVMLMHALLDRPQYVEELSERLNLSASTVSFHLKKLEQAKLVHHVKEQYYVMYHVNREALSLTLNDLLTVHDVKKTAQEARLQQYRQNVLQTFFRNGRLERLPAQQKKRRILLEELVKLFKVGQIYPEQAVNEVIAVYYDDYCTIRRDMIGEGLLQRENGHYWLADAEYAGTPQFPTENTIKPYEEHTMDRRKALIREYKENPPPAGIFQVKNMVNGKILIGKGLNVQGKLNGQRAQLEFKGHINKALQADWDTYGPENFVFEVLDFLDEDAARQENQSEELAALEEMWLDKLQPYGDKGYNRKPKTPPVRP